MIPANTPRRRVPGHPLILAAVAVGALVAGAGIAAIATSGSSSLASSSPGAPSRTPAPSASGRPVPGFRGPGGGLSSGGGGFFSGLGPYGAVHGQLVVPRSGGGYQTEDVQRGSVTAISSTSLTVKSADGFTKTYRVTGSTAVIPPGGTISSVKTGQQVSVTATVSGATATVTQIVDLALLGNGFAPGGTGQGSASG
jgi:hypothetical protein